MSAVAKTGVPSFVMGDFNVPSHLDWTPAVVAGGRVKLAVDWPVTRIMADAGFTDSFRAVHPDPVAVPGLTWTAGTPPPYVRAIEDDRPHRHDLVCRSGQGGSLGDRRRAGWPGCRASVSMSGRPITGPWSRPSM